MGERKGQNKYYPPDFDPTKGSLNSFLGVHALRERGKKAHLGIITIRFEMPFSIWCEGCGNHIGRGVRYNAEKKKTGNYYSTPIYLFKMRCHLCQQYFEIQTDPKNFDYELISGCKRQERRWEPGEGEMVQATEKEEKKKMASDPMYKLEHSFKDSSSAKTLASSVDTLCALQSRSKDDYSANKALRASLRSVKKEDKLIALADKMLLEKTSLSLALLPEHDDDKKLASLMAKFGTRKSLPEATMERRKRLAEGDIFSSDSEKRRSFPSSSISNLTSSSASSTSSQPFSLDTASPKRGAIFSRSLDKRTMVANRRAARATITRIAHRTAHDKLDASLLKDRLKLVKLRKSIHRQSVSTVSGVNDNDCGNLAFPYAIENRFNASFISGPKINKVSDSGNSASLIGGNTTPNSSLNGLKSTEISNPFATESGQNRSVVVDVECSSGRSRTSDLIGKVADEDCVVVSGTIKTAEGDESRERSCAVPLVDDKFAVASDVTAVGMASADVDCSRETAILDSRKRGDDVRRSGLSRSLVSLDYCESESDVSDH